MFRYRMTLAVWLSVLLLSACASSPAPTSAAFKAVPVKGDPRITLSTTNDMLLVDIISPTGIGSAAD